MPRIRTGQQKNTRTWQQTIVERIRTGKVVPVVSNIVGDDLLLGSHDGLVEAYVKYTEYPFPEKHDLSRIAQFLGVIDENLGDIRAVKEDYINFIKNRMFDLAEQDGVSRAVLDELEAQFDEINFMNFSARLGYPKFNQQMDPLLVLAEFPLPVYLTTSYHNFLEVALERVGKRPRTEICYWHKGLERIPSVLDTDYQPSVEEPLVYHLHGADTHPGSMVLTEDDYMEFLVAVSQNVGREADPVPRRIRQAMADSSLVLLGYNLRNWDFRVLFWGLIKPRPLQQTSVSIQIEPDEFEKEYLQKYLSEYEFKVYWGTMSQYLQEIRQEWER
jgi:hypothetical protein